ncbi:hypothetical protein LVD17_00020 [Fulvivirga ulvae]|uniref:hypothetical protein n=1 Tax=Fulvivirga ulvae TaxID=2904245 RepID=UPI001F1EDFD8|nr:hypothetical protein [Fulvivirga ulvae]UII32221.1 hypothetical protein LVD17_00020 [Fulvivirga ulvae]
MLGKEIMLDAAKDIFGYKSNFSDKLSENEIRELFLWLTRAFPKEDDPQFEGAHMVTSREEISHFRDNLIIKLQDRGTSKSIEMLEDLEKVSGYDLKYYIIKAKESYRINNWVPIEPKDLLRMTNNSLSRLILNNEDLLSAVLESLERLEKKLHGETPLSFLLWNSLGGDIYKPKEENDLSDYIKSHLVDDLSKTNLLILREVEIRRGTGKRGQPGERTDIYVLGKVPNTSNFVKLIIEVKGCWHNEINKAMETQLLKRYMNENDCDYGLYLIGWFHCSQWPNKDDTRKNRIGVTDLKRAQSKFDDQASQLSDQDKRVRACVLNCTLR